MTANSMTADSPYNENSLLRLDIMTCENVDCARCSRLLHRGQLIAFFSDSKSPFAWLLCLSCAKTKLDDYVPIWLQP